MQTLARRLAAGGLVLCLVPLAASASSDLEEELVRDDALVLEEADLLDDVRALEAFVDGLVRPLMRNHNSPSGVVAIARGGELLLARGYGYQDIEAGNPVDPARTLFRPGSVSKLFTWVAVMQLVEQGRVDLDADVNDYLDNFRIRDTFPEPITLRHVLTHTTGFEDGAMGYLIIDDPGRIMPLAESMARYQPARVNPPGAQTAYSNYATAVAGLIIENVSGMPFADYVREHIFDPLGMARSTFLEPLPDDLAADMAKSYGVEAGGFVEKPFEIISNFGPAGAQSATAMDMIRFGQAVLNGGELDGGRILEADTLAQMLTRAFSHDDRLMGMALGFYEIEENGVRIVGHGGDTRWFHSYLGIDQTNDITFFVSFGGSGGGTVRSAFTPAFYDHYFPTERVRPEPAAGFAERAGRYTGSYAFWRSNFSKIEKALGLGNVVQVSATPADTLVVSFGGGAKQYVEAGDNLFRELNPGISLIAGISPPALAFQEDASGRITGFVMDGLPFMSLRKLPLVATPNFNFTLLALALLIFAGVLARRWYQRAEIRAWGSTDRAAIGAAVYVAAAHLLVVASGGVVLSVVMGSLFGGIPLLFKLWLVLPIVAALASVYLVYRTVEVWRRSLLASLWSRMRYSVVTAGALFMCWFYYYWNILGFQYLE